MSTTKLWALIVAFTLALMALLTGASFAANGWLAHLLVTSGSVLGGSAILAALAVPCLVVAATFAYALEKPLG